MMSSLSRPTPKLHVTVSQEDMDKGTRSSFSISALPDSGSSSTIISLDLLQKHDMKFNKSNKERLFVFGDGQVRCAGSVQLKLCTGSSEALVRAVVCSEVRGALLIGWKDMIKLRLLNPRFPAVCYPPSRRSKKQHRSTRHRTKQYFDHHSKVPGDLYPGQKVLIQDFKTKKWSKPGVIISKNKYGHSYSVEIDGKTRWRNRRFIRELTPRKGAETPQENTSDPTNESTEKTAPKPILKKTVLKKTRFVSLAYAKLYITYLYRQIATSFCLK